MPYTARVFNIMIASPGDVEQERQIAAEVIYEWNNLNARERSLVLLPLRWETHASPELGMRPQAVINKQVVDYCDIVVGVFWTRLGTPTGQADSGTVEEIERARKAGKIVMLYFSSAKADLETTDIEEYNRLREFKSRTCPEGLIESFSSTSEFKDKFSKQLAMKVRDLANHNVENRHNNKEYNSISISVNVGVGSPCRILDRHDHVNVERIICKNIDEIPSYHENFIPLTNEKYYVELVRHYTFMRKVWPFRLVFCNSGDVGVKGLHLEISIENYDNCLELMHFIDSRKP